MELHFTAELEEHYRRFVERALRAGSVWTLECNDGWLTVTTHDGERQIIPLWSDAAYARRALGHVPADGYAVKKVPLETLLRHTLGNFQHGDALVGPNCTPDFACVEIDPRELFDELRCRMSETERIRYRDALCEASILTIGHSVEKLERRIAAFGRIVVLTPHASPSILKRGAEPVHVEIRARPGSSFVPLWSSGVAAERARRFCFSGGDPIAVATVELEDFLSTAEREGWSIGVDPTIGLACIAVSPSVVAASMRTAKEETEQQGPDSDA
jgi:hypothetical protein